jgi:hypothetical protein
MGVRNCEEFVLYRSLADCLTWFHLPLPLDISHHVFHLFFGLDTPARGENHPSSKEKWWNQAPPPWWTFLDQLVEAGSLTSLSPLVVRSHDGVLSALGGVGKFFGQRSVQDAKLTYTLMHRTLLQNYLPASTSENHQATTVCGRFPTIISS